MIEGFETSDSWNVANGYYLNAYLSPWAAHDGNYGLDQYNGQQWMYRSDAAAQVARGDTISVWLQFAGSADGRAYFGFGASAAGTLSIVAAPNTGQLILQNNVGWNFTQLAAVNQSYLPNHWYRLEVDWGASGTIVGKLFDSNGTTLLNSVTAATNGHHLGRHRLSCDRQRQVLGHGNRAVRREQFRLSESDRAPGQRPQRMVGRLVCLAGQQQSRIQHGRDGARHRLVAIPIRAGPRSVLLYQPRTPQLRLLRRVHDGGMAGPNGTGEHVRVTLRA